jgi:hypothetical protein
MHDTRWQEVAYYIRNCYGRKHTEETAMLAEEMNKTGDFSEFYGMGKVSLVI